ncbi:HAD family phosphatase [Rhodoferax sp.]|uniref:HAD family hydrolase n=1 Tax=Rhodoferax sp. TaxID=50421 RepID=UPI002840AF1E|nr:HAD family phosphatase [Rhodoferax sp.]MDR3370069.1 HAD family phosphatase [Rhodoferax sp.]
MNIVFDFGAVLFSWQPGALLLQTFPQQVHTHEEAAHLVHQIFGHPDWHDFDRGVLDADVVIARTAHRLDLPLEPMGDLVHGIGERLTPIEETVAVLLQLHQRRQAGDGVQGLYYLSNMPIPYARLLEERYPFLQWFDGGIFSGDVLHIKPDLAIYQLLHSRYGLVPERTVFIDDLKANVKAAQSLGWQGIHFESAQQLQADLALLGL